MTKPQRSPSTIKPCSTPARPWLALILFAVGGFIASSCGATEVTRSEVAEELSSELVGPSYTSLAAETETLHEQATQFCEQPTEETLEATLTQLDQVAATWHKRATFDFGPTEWRRSKNEFGTEFDPERIQGLLDNPGDSQLDADYLSSKTSTSQRGLGALYFLLGATSDDAADTVDDVSQRCDYLRAATESIKIEASALDKEWNISWNGGDAYIEIWSNDPEMAIDDVVNNSIFVLEGVRRMQLAPLLEPEPAPGTEGRLGDIFVEQRIVSVRNVLFGPDDESGLAGLVSNELAERLREQADAVDAELDSLARPIASASEGNPDGLRQLDQAVDTLVVTLSTELASELGVTLSFSDADGDSG